MEYAGEGADLENYIQNLSEYSKDEHNEVIDLMKIKQIMKNIFEGISHLH